MSRQGYVVCEGRGTYHIGTGYNELTRQGIEQSELAAKKLVDAGVTKEALILSSPSMRSRETALRIGHVLGCEEFPVVNPILQEAGVSPNAVENIAAIVDPVLEQANIRDEDRDIVLVTHVGLVAAVSGNASADYGEVVPVDIDTWKNSMYDPREEERLLRGMIG